MSAGSQTASDRPRPKAVKSASRRDLIGRLAAVAVGGLLVAGGLGFADFHRRAPTSATLFQPLIEHHTKQSADQLDRVRSDWRNAGDSLTSAMRHFYSAVVFAYRACTRIQEPNDVIPTDWRYARSYFQHCNDSLGNAMERIWDVGWHVRMSKYHMHASQYYSRLLAARMTVLPLLPPDLAAERRAAEAEYLRYHGIKYTLPPEPPPHLVPARRSDDVTASFPVAPPDSD